MVDVRVVNSIVVSDMDMTYCETTKLVYKLIICTIHFLNRANREEKQMKKVKNRLND